MSVSLLSLKNVPLDSWKPMKKPNQKKQWDKGKDLPPCFTQGTCPYQSVMLSGTCDTDCPYRNVHKKD